MVFSYTLITITTMNSRKLTVVSEVSGEHTVFWRWWCVLHEWHAPWWYWATKVMVTSSLMRQIREETHVFSILPHHCWCFSLLVTPFLTKQDLYYFGFSHSSFWSIWQEVLLADSSACLVLYLADSRCTHPWASPMLLSPIGGLHKMCMHGSGCAITTLHNTCCW